MQLSMTGFGKQIAQYEQKKITIEIKSLNSKTSDISMRLPGRYKEKEMDLRQLLSKTLERGKIDFLLFIEDQKESVASQINIPIFKAYHNTLSHLALELGKKNTDDLFAVIARMPDVISAEEKADLDPAEWAVVLSCCQDALKNLIQFREKEGSVLCQELEQRIQLILEKLKNIEPFEQERIGKIKEKIWQQFQEAGLSVSQERLEQELIFYLEKLDISEERLRLHTHCQYFLKTMQNENAAGRKLGFILQEIGREINTMGSKANNSQMQKLVVEMKDELEKIKEQSLNLL